MRSKECSKCKSVLDIKYFSFRSDTNKYRNQCNKCYKGYLSNREDFVNERNLLLESGRKKCSNCNEIKDLDLFSVDKHTSTGHSSRCKECIKIINSTKDKIKTRVNRIKKIYSIGFDEAASMITKRNCDICGIEFEPSAKKNSRNLNIDHCHKTGVVRGVLCGKCNRAIGLLNDDIRILKSAIKYLSR